MQISFTIPGEPIPLKRARAFKNFNSIAFFDPQIKEKNWYKSVIRSNLIDKCNYQFDSITIHCKYYLQVPMYKSSHTNSLEWGIITHSSKPDIDNLNKFIYDCLSGIVFEDDRQIYFEKSVKLYSRHPRTEVKIIFNKDNPDSKLRHVSQEFIRDLIKDSTELSNLYLQFTSCDPGEEFKFSSLIEDFMIKFSEKYTPTLKKVSNGK